MAKNFRELEREALADPKRRANIERERTLLLGAMRLRDLRTARGGALRRRPRRSATG